MKNKPKNESSPVRRGYNNWAKQYDTDGNPLMALEGGIVPGLWGDIKGKRIVDLGCGTGRHVNRLIKDGAEVVGIDFSEKMLKEASEKISSGRAKFIQHDIRKPLPFDDNQFDGILSTLVFEHIENIESLFREMKRICKPGGFILISEMHPAMRLKGAQAAYTNPGTGEKIKLRSINHTVSDFVKSAINCGLNNSEIREDEGTEKLAAKKPRAKNYISWPMLLILKLDNGDGAY
jgi:ubiquinone/menaquinone biosynthesis C-methylase UbiE